jgi:hypothetical protein
MDGGRVFEMATHDLGPIGGGSIFSIHQPRLADEQMVHANVLCIVRSCEFVR